MSPRSVFASPRWRRVAALALLLPLPPLAAQSEASTVVREALVRDTLRGARWPRISDVRVELQRTYDSVAWQPLWLREGRPSANAMSVVRYLALLDGVGLRPSDYDAGRIEALATLLRDSSGTPSPDSAAQFEALTSVAVARVLGALQWGRVNPRDAHEAFRVEHSDYDRSAAMRTMAAGSDPTAVFNDAEPQLLHYRLLKAQLAQYREMARDSTEPAARTRMAQRMAQMELSMERWRWLPHAFPGRVIIVNIPEFRLHAFDRLTADSTTLFSMDVVVGQAFDHKTPIFMRDLEYIAFSPYWEVPTSIARKEIRPKALKASSYLARNRYVLMRGNTIVPTTSANIAAIGASVRVRQLPGKDNSLGRVKFMLPNPHNIYLHDTPVQSAFTRERRDLSHGCIRLSDPVALAQWLLHDEPQWTPEALEEAMSRRAPLDVPLREKVPVLILYGTAIAERSGAMRFYRDIYGHDRQLTTLLARGYPYPR